MFKAIIFDYGRTLHNPESDSLYAGVESLLSKLSKKEVRLALVSKTENVKQRWKDFERFNLTDYFQITAVFPATSIKDLGLIVKKLRVQPDQCLIVGDRIKMDITEGNKIGATTIWAQQGKFKDEMPDSDQQPNYTVNSIAELTTLLNSLL